MGDAYALLQGEARKSIAGPSIALAQARLQPTNSNILQNSRKLSIILTKQILKTRLERSKRNLCGLA
jgi:hypothetical protein